MSPSTELVQAAIDELVQISRGVTNDPTEMSKVATDRLNTLISGYQDVAKRLANEALHHQEVEARLQTDLQRRFIVAEEKHDEIQAGLHRRLTDEAARHNQVEAQIATELERAQHDTDRHRARAEEAERKLQREQDRHTAELANTCTKLLDAQEDAREARRGSEHHASEASKARQELAALRANPQATSIDPMDTEIRALQHITTALQSLNETQRTRTISWLNARWISERTAKA